jgi:hypothetical protein
MVCIACLSTLNIAALSNRKTTTWRQREHQHKLNDSDSEQFRTPQPHRAVSAARKTRMAVDATLLSPQHPLRSTSALVLDNCLH